MRRQYTYSRHIVSRVLTILTLYNVYTYLYFYSTALTSLRMISHNDRSLYSNMSSASYSPSTKGTSTMAVVEDFWTGAPFPGGAIPAR